MFSEGEHQLTVTNKCLHLLKLNQINLTSYQIIDHTMCRFIDMQQRQQKLSDDTI